MRRYALCVIIVLGFVRPVEADTFGTGDNQFTIEFVPISGRTNPADTNVSGGYGIVNNDYRIGVYEITNDQWGKFVDAYGPVAGYPSNAYDEDAYLTGTNLPTTNVSWYEAAQFVNWLNTDAGHLPAYKFAGTQGTGGYALDTWSAAEAAGGTNLYRHKDAFYFLPTEDEWVKAAYFNGTMLQTYATKDNTTPNEWTPAGGSNSDGQAAGWNYGHAYPDNNSSSDLPWYVNAGYSSEELNGTHDMMGNVCEWMESPCIDSDYGAGSRRGLRGGHWYNLSNALHASNRDVNINETYTNPAYESSAIGFRVASVPEPGSIALLLCGAIGLLAYGCRRRRTV